MVWIDKEFTLLEIIYMYYLYKYITTIFLYLNPKPGNAVKECKLFNYDFAIGMEFLDFGINFPVNR